MNQTQLIDSSSPLERLKFAHVAYAVAVQTRTDRNNRSVVDSILGRIECSKAYGNDVDLQFVLTGRTVGCRALYWPQYFIICSCCPRRIFVTSASVVRNNHWFWRSVCCAISGAFGLTVLSDLMICTSTMQSTDTLECIECGK